MLVCLSYVCLLKILGGLLKRVFKIKEPKNGLILAIFKLLDLSYMNTIRVPAKLVCAFVFAYANGCFSDA